MRSRGYTLSELLVVLVLFLILLGILYQVLVPAFEVSIQASVRRELQQAAGVIMGRLEQEFEAAASNSVSFDQEILGFQSLVDVEPTRGLQLWDQEVTVYFRDPAEQTLVRLTTPAADSNRPVRLTPAQLAAATTTHPPSRRVLGRGVRVFSVVAPPSTYNTGYPQPVEVRLELEGRVTRPAPKTLSFQTVRRFTVRNRSL